MHSNLHCTFFFFFFFRKISDAITMYLIFYLRYKNPQYLIFFSNKRAVYFIYLLFDTNTSYILYCAFIYRTMGGVSLFSDSDRLSNSACPID